MALDFKTSLAVVLHHEGGFSDHEDDSGGATKWGISIRFLKLARLDLNADGVVSEADIRDMTPAQAEDIYRTKFWDRCSCDDLPPGIDLAVFDCAVNQGQPTARKLLQKAAGVKADGLIGPKTLGAVQARPDAVLTDFMARRATRYGLLSIFKTFGLGWMRRIFDVHRSALSMR